MEPRTALSQDAGGEEDQRCGCSRECNSVADLPRVGRTMALCSNTANKWNQNQTGLHRGKSVLGNRIKDGSVIGDLALGNWAMFLKEVTVHARVRKANGKHWSAEMGVG